MSYGSFARISGAAALLLALSASAVVAGEYREPKGVFAITYDDRIWSIDKDDSDFGLECREEACKGAGAGCSVHKQWIPLHSAASIMQLLDGKELAKAHIEGFAEEKASSEKAHAGRVNWDRTSDVPPQLVQPFASRRIGGLAFTQAEYRMSLLGDVVRFVSYVTAGASYGIFVMCRGSEDAIKEWRPRFEALAASLRIPAPKSR
jgi:hypothetical protein